MVVDCILSKRGFTVPADEYSLAVCCLQLVEIIVNVQVATLATLYTYTGSSIMGHDDVA